MKRITAALLIILMLCGSLCCCSRTSEVSGGETDPSGNGSAGRKLKIVAAIFPEYDWVMNIRGEDAANAEVSLLLDKGVDMHSFQPSAADILKISGCDMFIYVGGVSDEWAGAVLKEAVNKDMAVVNLLELLDVPCWEFSSLIMLPMSS